MSKYEMPVCRRKTTIGGQAIIEGIVMKGPKRTCVVVRKGDGTLEIKERDSAVAKSRFWKLPSAAARWPVHGPERGLARYRYSSQFIEDDKDTEPSKFELWLERKLGSEKLEKASWALPWWSVSPFRSACSCCCLRLSAACCRAGTSNIARNLVEAALRILIFLSFMWSVSHMKDIKRTFEYHGAEHKTIFCYEAELPLTVENVRKMPRFHPRCGTSFMFVLIIVATVVSSIVFFADHHYQPVFAGADPFDHPAARRGHLL